MHFDKSVRALVAPVVLFGLAACGGGGGGSSGKDLEVAFNYGAADPTYTLWTPMEQSPTLQGLGNETPSCKLASGVLPTGVTVNRSTCALEGTPTDLGTFKYRVTLTVDGFDGSVSADGRMDIVKPAFSYRDSGILGWKMPWEASPQWPAGFQLLKGDTLGDYRVVDSVLPAGLTIDAKTGVISGTFTGFSASRFSIATTITHGGQTFNIESPIQNPIISPPSVGLPATQGEAIHVGDSVITPTPIFSDGTAIAAPYQGDFRIDMGVSWPCQTPHALPPGLILNPSTGVITGVPTAPFSGCISMRYEISAPDGGGSVMGWLQMPLGVQP
jgi:hypothetical protein